jgi:putative hemolysin
MQFNPVAPPLTSPPAPPLIDPRELLFSALKRRIFSDPLARLLSQVLNIEGLNQLYSCVATLPPGIPFYEGILQELNVEVDLASPELARIPTKGPVLLVANHPLGALEGVVLILALTRVRSDARVMANYLMARVPQLAGPVIPVDPFGGAAATRANLSAMRDALHWLRGGGAVGTFPAGEVSAWNARERRVEDRPWNPNIARLARRTGASVVPVFFGGSNGLAFHLGGILHPRLRTAQLAREFLGKRDRRLAMHIGNPIDAETLAGWGNDEECIAMLRHRTYLLAARSTHAHGTKEFNNWVPRPANGLLRLKAVGPAQPQELLDREVLDLPASARLAEAGDLVVYSTTSPQSPAILREIGRLRELTFREAGEGSGKALDLDRFDRAYQHLFVWNRQAREIVGAYRLRMLQPEGRRQRPPDSYINTLFHFRPGFFEQLGPAIELGRSFIRREYQRSPNGLMMLWKGIAKLAREHPEHTRLIGPVSISNQYSACSRQILVHALGAQAKYHPLSPLVHPRKPFRHRRLPGWRPELTRMLPCESQALSALIAEIEADGKGMPVLLRQYLKLGGVTLAFNVDPQFSQVLDGLIVVDLLQTDPNLLSRYMGREETLAYRELAGKTHRTARPEPLSI